MFKDFFKRLQMKWNGWTEFRTREDKKWIDLCCYFVESDKVTIGKYTLIRGKGGKK